MGSRTGTALVLSGLFMDTVENNPKKVVGGGCVRRLFCWHYGYFTDYRILWSRVGGAALAAVTTGDTVSVSPLCDSLYLLWHTVQQTLGFTLSLQYRIICCILGR